LPYLFDSGFVPHRNCFVIPEHRRYQCPHFFDKQPLDLFGNKGGHDKRCCQFYAILPNLLSPLDCYHVFAVRMNDHPPKYHFTTTINNNNNNNQPTILRNFLALNKNTRYTKMLLSSSNFAGKTGKTTRVITMLSSTIFAT